MCGIGGIYIKDDYIDSFPLEDFSDMLMLGLESRGRDATGVVSVTKDGTVSLEKDASSARMFVLQRKSPDEETKMSLVHTRWETQGDKNNPANNHPVGRGGCYVVHNGHINNDTQIFEDLSLNRIGQVDSEAIVACLSTNGMDTSENIVKSLETLEGSFAIAAIDPVANPGKLLLAKGDSSPLVILNHRKCIIWASELEVIKQAWGLVIGTPPEKSVFWGGTYAASIPDYGYHRLTSGDYWIIQDDKITRGKFKPKDTWVYKPYNYSSIRTPHDYEAITVEQVDKDGYAKIVRTSRVAANGDIIPIDKKYYCEPTMMACKFACKQGCLTAGCDCFVTEDRKERVSLATEDLRNLAENNPFCYLCNSKVCSSPNYCDFLEKAHNEEENSVRCESCWEHFSESEIAENGGWGFFDSNICKDCNEAASGWSTKTVVSLDDKREEHYQEIAEKESELTKKTCAAVAELMHTTPMYIEWLLFAAKIEDLESNKKLGKSRTIADGHYADIYEQLKKGDNVSSVSQKDA